MNIYGVKKLSALVMLGLMPTLVFTIAIIFWGYFFAIAFLFVFLALFIVLALRMLKHPMLEMIEGKGMMTMTWDSSGLIETFTVQADPPFVKGIYKGKMRETMFDREIVSYIIPPQPARMADATCLDAEGNVVGTRKVLIMPTRDEKADYLFRFGTYPTFIYNKSLGNFLQKSMLSDFESNTFVNHMVLYLLKKTEDLSGHVRDFARYIVEQTRPQAGWFQKNRWVLWLVLAGAIIGLALLFIPGLMSAFEGTSLPSLPNPGAVTP